MAHDYCPNCEMDSVRRFRCQRCGTDFHTGHILDRAPRRSSSVILPTLREAAPNRVALMFRDKSPRGCSLRYKRKGDVL